MPEIKKVVIKVDIHNGDDKRKALKAVSTLSGIDSLAIDMKDKKLTITGDIDPVDVFGKLKKWKPTILTFGPAKEAKDPQPDKQPEVDPEFIRRLLELNNQFVRQRYYHYGDYSVEEDPNGCVIC